MAFEPPEPSSAIGLTGARFGGARRVEPDRQPEPEPAPQPPPPASDDVEWTLRPETHAMVRPYAWTGGRTRSRAPLAIEALVHAARPAPSWEHRPITDVCATPRSVAEVAALLNVPLGVARVLIGDLADQGVLVVERLDGDAPDLAMLNRVLAGLHRI